MNYTAITQAALLLASGAVCSAFTPGGVAYTKRMETKLLESPSALARTNASVGFGKKLQVKEVKGPWLLLEESQAEGWVFQGNVSAVELKEVAGLDIVPLSAKATQSTAAARPLAPAASEYALRKGKAAARGDIEWLETQASKYGVEEITAYLEKAKKGEYAEGVNEEAQQ